jgi:hypothetical protein
MRWRISFSVVLAAFVAVSCEQQPVEPLPDAVVAAPTFDFTNGPSNSGPFVARYPDGFVGGWTVFGEELWAFLYSWDGETCEVLTDLELVPLLEISNPSGDDLYMQTWKGDVNVLVGTYPPVCANVVAYGMAHLVNNDNDVLAWLEGRDRNRVNSFGFRATGRLNVTDGSTAQLLALYRLVWTGYPDEEYINTVEKVQLK